MALKLNVGVIAQGRPAGLRLGRRLVQPRAGARRRPARARPGRLPRPGPRVPTSPPTRPSTTSWPACRRPVAAPQDPPASPPRHASNGHAGGNGHADRPPAGRSRPRKPATENQVRAIRSIASRQHADLDGLLRELRRRAARGPVAQAGVRADRHAQDGRQRSERPVSRPYAFATRSSPREGPSHGQSDRGREDALAGPHPGPDRPADRGDHRRRAGPDRADQAARPGAGRWTSLGLAGFQEELDRIAAQRAELDRRDRQARRAMLARVRGVSADDLEAATPACTITPRSARRSTSGRRSTRRSCWPGTSWAARSCELRAEKENLLDVDLAGDLAEPGPPALDQGRRAAGRGADGRWSARRCRSRRPARRSDEPTLSRSAAEAARPAAAPSLPRRRVRRSGPAVSRTSASGTSTTCSSRRSAAAIAGSSSTGRAAVSSWRWA